MCIIQIPSFDYVFGRGELSGESAPVQTAPRGCNILVPALLISQAHLTLAVPDKTPTQPALATSAR
jgi:hypothetical protein